MRKWEKLHTMTNTHDKFKMPVQECQQADFMNVNVTDTVHINNNRIHEVFINGSGLSLNFGRRYNYNNVPNYLPILILNSSFFPGLIGTLPPISSCWEGII